MSDSLSLNRANWDERATAHARSAGYGIERYVEDPTFIGEVVRFDLPRLGDVRGLRGLHLQCHIGTDTISLSRLGARMTGLDFSPVALKEARDLAGRAGAEIRFVEAAVYDAPSMLEAHSFDFVFTGVGALCWLPDVHRWAEVVSSLLRPGGWLFLREGHPVLWSLGERQDELLVLEYPYFERPEPQVWDEPGTYVETDVTFRHTVTHEWNHGLGEIVTALMENGMHLSMLVEHDSVPWDALPGHMELTDGKEWRLIDRPWRLPHSYTLSAIRRTET